jgi:xanthine dehydrogenase accessory factor
MRDWLRTLHDALRARSEPVVRVVVAAVRGSAPREPGACMLVSTRSEIGTIGGGHLEFVATRIARDLLESPTGSARLDRFSLGASLGQCCGGIVELWFQRYDASDLGFLAQALAARETGEASVMASTAIAESGARQRLLSHESAVREGAGALDGEQDAVLLHHAQGPMLYERILRRDTRLWLFGAGHVASALVHVLAPLPFAITWVDSREGMLADALPTNVRAVHSPQPAEELLDMEAGAWALVMTHSHDEDFSLCEALLRHGRFGWAGVIGSQPKAKRFRQRLLQRGFSAQEISRLAMPIGIDGIRSKEAAAIAVAVAAQLLQERERRATREELIKTAARKS